MLTLPLRPPIAGITGFVWLTLYRGMKFDYPRSDADIELRMNSGTIEIARIDAATSTGKFVAYTRPDAKVKFPTVDEIVLVGGVQ